MRSAGSGCDADRSGELPGTAGVVGAVATFKMQHLGASSAGLGDSAIADGCAVDNAVASCR